MNDTEVTQVVCAAIIRDGKYLICRREPSDHLGGYWEFPGGKVAAEESLEEALVREIREELGISIILQYHLGKSHFRMTGADGTLDAFLCSFDQGIIDLKVHDKCLWVSVEEMGNFNFAPADLPFVEELQKWLWPIRLRNILALREAGDTEEALSRILALHRDYPGESMIPYQIARTYEVLGQDQEAIPYYQEALEQGLEGALRKQVLIGLGNNLREKKRYKESQGPPRTSLGRIPQKSGYQSILGLNPICSKRLRFGLFTPPARASRKYRPSRPPWVPRSFTLLQ
jgi:8-oxo-dGTP diphosphatase